MIAPRPLTPRLVDVPAPALAVPDLLHDLTELAALLREQLADQQWLDSFLLAAGMNQVTEDYLHRDPAGLGKAAAIVGGPGGRAMRMLRRAVIAARTAAPGDAAVISWQRELNDLVLSLATVVAGARTSLPDGRAVVAGEAALPRALRTEIVRLPSCFRSLDLMPEDVARLADRFAERQPGRSAPVLVVGVRTSGSYLAPLLAAHLMRRGFEAIGQMTVRPGHGLLRHERAMLGRAVGAGAVAVVIDDPPSSGTAVAKSAALLQAVGFGQSQVVLCLPLLGKTLPEALAGLHSVTLERRFWGIESQLQPAFIEHALQDMRGVVRVETVRRLPLPDIDDPWEESVDRRHVRALYAVDVRLDGGLTSRRYVYAKGTGLGYFGRHSLAVAQRMHDYVPESFGVAGSLLLREWQPEAWRAGAGADAAGLPLRVAEYVSARERRLPVERDLALRLIGRQAVWQRTADLLLLPFGRLRLALRPFVHRLARRLLQSPTPSAIDGSMGLQHWFAQPGGAAVKVDYDERAFSNEDIYSYDAAYDLGAAAASLRARVGLPAAAAARAEYESLSGKPVDEERWFLYQLLSAHLSRQTLRVHAKGSAIHARSRVIELLDGAEEALESIQRDYMRACFLRDIGVRRDGPLCAVDIDGTLETAPLGFTAIGPHGALALRALAAHGYRTVLASGRSLDEVRARCAAYSLPAGVAEYGAVVFDSTTGEHIEVLTETDRSNLERVRASAAAFDDVHVDDRYRRSVRAFTLDRGRRRGLADQTAAAILAAAGVRESVVAVSGWSQTDFISANVDKAVGLRAAARLIGADEDSVELAVGDAVPDLPMLRLAKLACIPANGDSKLRGAPGFVMSRSGQAGLGDAVARLIGHHPGSCGVCAAPDLDLNAQLLTDVLAIYEERGWSKVRGALAFAWRLRGVR